MFFFQIPSHLLIFVPFLIADVYTGLFGLFNLFKKESWLLFCVNMKRKINYFILFSLVCFWWLCKPVCRRLTFIYCGWRGRGRRGVLLFLPPFSPTVRFFAMTATALFTNSCRKCCMLSAGRDVASVKGRRAKSSVLSSVFSLFGMPEGNICPPVGFFSSQLRGTFIFFFKQRLSKETALLGLSI